MHEIPEIDGTQRTIFIIAELEHEFVEYFNILRAR
jgi:hypothetical protein